MARPLKIGLDYFSLDTDFFRNMKVRRIKMACGPQGLTVLVSLLCNIYREKGYYILWDENLPFLIADEIGVTEGAAEEVIKKAVQVKLFDPKLASKGVLTSLEIQERYSKVCRDAKRTNWKINPKIKLTQDETELTPEETPLPPPKSAQRKEDNSTEKKTQQDEKKKSYRFSPPSQDQVQEYLIEKKLHPALAKKEAAKFWSFYDSKNWYVGKNKMTKWKSAATGWINRMDDPKPNQYGKSNTNAEPRVNRQTADVIYQNSQGWEIE